MVTATVIEKKTKLPALLPAGVWPVAVTPFKVNGAIDWKVYDQLLDWYMGKGSAGIFAVCLSSEFYHLTAKEQIELAKVAVKRCSGTIPVVAGGGLGKNLREVIDSVKATGDVGAEAVIIPVNQLVAADQTEGDLIRQFDLLLSLTGDIALGLYECPSPYHRTVSEDILRYCSQTGRFRFIKDTCGNAKQIGHKVAACGKSNIGVYNANINTLLDSMNVGCRGYNGPAANFYPDLIAAMMKSTNPEKTRLLENIIISGQRTVTYKYLPTAKVFLKLSGIDISDYCRMESLKLTKADVESIQAFYHLIEYCRNELI
jgi:4-hydroxy-tetrahydrodipicolinate synthase